MDNAQTLPDHAQAQAIEGILASASDLTDILNKETEYLKAADTKGFRSLHDQKTEYAARYESQLMKLISNKEQLKSAPPEALAKLQEARKDMAQASKENLTALERTNKSLNRISERLLNLAREKSSNDKLAYSNKGALYSNSKRPVSVGITETV